MEEKILPYEGRTQDTGGATCTRTNHTEAKIRLKSAFHALDEERTEVYNEFEDREDELEDQLALARKETDDEDEDDDDDDDIEYYLY